MPKPKKPVVIVSGCFDLLHSGHVQFFKEAAQHGELHVRIGSDKNIQQLKNHLPMYSEQERLFMIQNIKWVHDAKVSEGTGRYDFLTDMEKLKPDIYFVNEDAGGLEGRIPLVEKLGIKVIVNPRKPAEGLEVRSSTSMKARLREMAEHEEKLKDAKKAAGGIEAFHKVIPWRICFAGGWMDLAWCNQYYPGCAVTINIKFNPKVCKDRCGLATSSRKCWVKLWNGKRPDHLGAMEAAKMLWGAENFDCYATMERPYSAGSQDHCGLMFPGVNKLEYKGGKHWPYNVVNLNDAKDPKQAKIFSWLMDVISLVEIPFESRPKGYNSQTINHLKDPKISPYEKVQMVKALAEASELAWKSIVSMDIDNLGKALSDTMKGWAGILPYTVNPYHGDEGKSKKLRDFVAKYDYPNTKGCLFSGAGGGFLFVISEKPVENGIKIEINHDPICKPFPSDKL